MDEPHQLAMSWEFPEEPVSRIHVRLHAAEEGTLMDFMHHGLGASSISTAQAGSPTSRTWKPP